MTKKLWLRISESFRYFLVGLMGLIPVSDIIAPHNVKWMCLIISILIYALKSIDYGVKGNAPSELKQKPSID